MKSLFTVACAAAIAAGLEVNDAQKAPEAIDVSWQIAHGFSIGLLQGPK